MQRRTFLAGVSAAGVTVGCNGFGTGDPPSPAPSAPSGRPDFVVEGVDQDAVLSNEELDDLHLEQLSLETGFSREDGTTTFEDWKLDYDLRKKIRNERVLPKIASGEFAPFLAAAAQSPDYAHLVSEAPSSAPFALDHATLESLCAANHFSGTFGQTLAGQSVPDDIVIFALRGCKVLNRATAAYPSDAVELQEQTVDHLNRRCAVGVWNRRTRKVSALSGSTVPHLSYLQLHRIHLHLKGRLELDDPTFTAVDRISEEMQRVATFPGWRANQLGQGLHLMTIGTHRANGRSYRLLPKQNDQWYGPVLRATDVPGYRAFDWDPSSRQVHDNIHPAWAFSTGGGTISFASAGCTTLHGGGAGTERNPYWGSIAALLYDINRDGERKNGDHYLYLLLTGREARLHAEGRGPERWRFGSSGPEVKRLQRVVGRPTSGLFDRATHDALVVWQQSNDRVPDGVVRPDQFPS